MQLLRILAAGSPILIPGLLVVAVIATVGAVLSVTTGGDGDTGVLVSEEPEDLGTRAERAADLERENAELTAEAAALVQELIGLRAGAAGRIPGLEPVGTAQPQLPPGAPGLAVVAVGEYVIQQYVSDPEPAGTVVPVAVRNNGTETVVNIALTATASLSGGLIVDGAGEGFLPHDVPPGTVAFGDVRFRDVELSPDMRIEFVVDALPISEVLEPHARDLLVIEHLALEQRILGRVANPIAKDILGPIQIGIACFGPDGEYRGYYEDRAELSRLDPGEITPFSVQVGDCPTYWIFALGFG